MVQISCVARGGARGHLHPQTLTVVHLIELTYKKRSNSMVFLPKNVQLHPQNKFLATPLVQSGFSTSNLLENRISWKNSRGFQMLQKAIKFYVPLSLESIAGGITTLGGHMFETPGQNWFFFHCKKRSSFSTWWKCFQDARKCDHCSTLWKNDVLPGNQSWLRTHKA